MRQQLLILFPFVGEHFCFCSPSHLLSFFFGSPRFVAWPLELGSGTRNPQLGILLELVEGKKMGFHPCGYTQNTQFFQENQIMDANQIGPNINTTPVHINYTNDSYPILESSAFASGRSWVHTPFGVFC